MTILTLDINDTNRADLIEYLTCCKSAATGEPLDFLTQMLEAIDKNRNGFTAEISEDNTLNFIGLLQESEIPSLVDTSCNMIHSICSRLAFESIGLGDIFHAHDKSPVQALIKGESDNCEIINNEANQSTSTNNT